MTICVGRRLLLRAALALACGAARAETPAQVAPANPIRVGASDRAADLGGFRLHVFTFKPAGCAITRILLVFHGTDRDAPLYREDATPLARRLCLLVVAPYFDPARFPPWAYELGGVVDQDAIQPEASRTVNVIVPLVQWVRAQEGRPDLGYALLGHSGGAQLLSRVAAYTNDMAARTVIVSPGGWVRPRLDIPAPYGFGKLYDAAAGEAALRRYLATPISVLIGSLDIGTHYRVANDQSDELGMNRLERTKFVFQEAESVAHKHHWPFNWRLAIVPGVGHSDSGMIGSEQAYAALAN